MSFDRTQMWNAVVSLAQVSHSYTSQNQRILSRVYTNLNAVGLASPALPQTVNIKQTVETTTGKVISKIT